MDPWSPRNVEALGGASTPTVLGDRQEAPRHGMLSVSRKWYSAYRDHCSYVTSCNDMVIQRRDQLTPEQMPRHVKQVSTTKYGTE